MLFFEENYDEVNALLRQIATEDAAGEVPFSEQRHEPRVFIGSGEDCLIIDGRPLMERG
jgi:hypothetical protein